MKAIPFILVLLILVFGAVTAVQTLTAPSGDPTPTPVRPTVTARPSPTSPGLFGTAQPLPALAAGPTSTPSSGTAPAAPSTAATATSTAQTVMKVGNTDREGVYIRRTPNMNDKIRPWMDGTPMTVLGPPQTVNGIIWIKVRAPDGVEGYVPAQYLVPSQG